MENSASAARMPPSFRLVGFLKQPDAASAGGGALIELDESEVLWSSAGAPAIESLETETRGLRRSLLPERLGLSAALAGGVEPQLVPAPGRAGGLGRLLRQSAPVNVPAWPGKSGRDGGGGGYWNAAVAEEEEEEEAARSSHVIVARSHVMTFSVFEGAGRTLKGRDLRRVRNAVFRQTGFLD